VLRGLRKRIDPRRYNGASLLGLRGIVIKSHGGVDSLAFRNAISIAKQEVLSDVANRIGRRVGEQLTDRATA
jgi:glycerol-3-phosphate acyltransferase PlsX